MVQGCTNGNRAQFELDDNASAFDRGVPIDDDSMRLTSMQERAEELGGLSMVVSEGEKTRAGVKAYR
jgi:signal transduction histidine kinase